MFELGENRYGKQAIRLVKVIRDPAGHRVRDLTVGVALEGDFAAAHTDGDNTLVVATDTMKNTVYALAADHLTGAIEAFGTVRGDPLPGLRAGPPGDGHHPRARLGADRRRRWPRRGRLPAHRRGDPDDQPGRHRGGAPSWSRASRTWSS